MLAGAGCAAQARLRPIARLLESFAHLLDGFRIDLPAILVRVELRFEHVAGLQEGIDHFVAQREFFLAQAVEQGFQNVGHFGHVGETESAAAALDGVGSPENGVEVVEIGRV